MLVTGIVLALVLVGAYIFLGMKLSESIIHADIKIFFWSLYFVTLITTINVSMSIYFYSSLKDKKGPLGSRGNKGRMGDRGKAGSCKYSDCKSKSVQIMIEEALQNHYNESDITPHERKIICNLINNEEPDTGDTSIKGNKHIINGTDKPGDHGWTLGDYNTFKKNFETNLDNPNPNYEFPEYKHFKQRLTEQEQPGSPLETHLKNLIVDSCKTDGTPWEAEKILNKNTTKECV